MEEFRIRLEGLLERLNRDIEIATINFNNLNDIRFRDMCNRWIAFRNILTSIQDNNDISQLIEFAQNTIDAIAWNNSEQGARDINIDSQKILLDILDLLPMVERPMVTPQNIEDRFRLILEHINARIENLLNVQE